MEFPDIIKVMDSHKRAKISKYPVRSNWASMIGDICLRRLVYHRTHWDKVPSHSVDLQYIFDEGHEQEASLGIELQKALRIVGGRFVGQNESVQIPGTEISGKIDGKILLGQVEYPVDIKSCDPNIWERINTIHDFNKYPWTMKYPAQILIYMYALKKEGGMLILKNKSKGRLKIFTFELKDYQDEIKKLLQKDKDISKHLKNKTFPDKINDPKVCEICSFQDICQPDFKVETKELVKDPKFQKSLERWFELKSLMTEYTKLDNEIKYKVKEKKLYLRQLYY